MHSKGKLLSIDYSNSNGSVASIETIGRYYLIRARLWIYLIDLNVIEMVI